jgi:hypothetical protein
MSLKIVLPSLLFFMLVNACGKSLETERYYGKLEKITGVGEGSIVAEAGDIRLSEEAEYLLSERDTINLVKAQSLDASIRDLLIQKALLRKAAVREGLDKGYFGDEGAAHYILPRIEKILEDYYYVREGNYDLLLQRSRSILPDDTVIAKQAESGKGRGYDLEKLLAERDRVAEALAEKKFSIEKERIMQELLKKYPQIIEAR